MSLQTVGFTEDEQLVKVFDNLPSTKDKLFLKANDWMIRTFNSAESVIQHSDKEDGVIIGKYLMHGTLSHGGPYSAAADTRVYAIIDIRVKDQKARIEIRPQDWKYDSSGMTVYNYSKQDAIADIQRLVDSFYNSLQKKDVEF